MKTYQLVGIGNAVVDVISQTEDAFLTENAIEKGIMQLIEQDRADSLRRMANRLQTPALVAYHRGPARLGWIPPYRAVRDDDLASSMPMR